MKSVMWIGMFLVTAVAASCHRTTTPPPPTYQQQPTPSTEWIAIYRQNIQATHPGSLVGVVNAVLPENHFASVGEIPVEQVKPGDLLTIVDGGGNPVVVGQVVKAVDGNVHLRYEEPQPGRRSPREGDAAVKLAK